MQLTWPHAWPMQGQVGQGLSREGHVGLSLFVFAQGKATLADQNQSRGHVGLFYTPQRKNVGLFYLAEEKTKLVS